jgi:hypothetical protein
MSPNTYHAVPAGDARDGLKAGSDTSPSDTDKSLFRLSDAYELMSEKSHNSVSLRAAEQVRIDFISSTVTVMDLPPPVVELDEASAHVFIGHRSQSAPPTASQKLTLEELEEAFSWI